MNEEGPEVALAPALPLVIVQPKGGMGSQRLRSCLSSKWIRIR
jgi:hypothetical protein